MKRIVILDKDKCNPEKCGNWLCFRLCPVNRMDKECITKNKKPIINEELCTGCAICSNKCPFEALSVINLPEKLKVDPIHRYGKNSFELFHLPIPKENKVVGILGRNGIGKTTALNILSGNLKPNLGNFEDPATEEDIIKRYSSITLGKYFKKLFNKEIKISYKPQRIELIPKIYKGKVKDLIKKIDETKKGDKFLEELDLKEIKNRNIKSLSGGELQKLAIIAAAIKKVDIYYFDEPASFCDVTARIKVAKIIRSLAKNASVIVVEHDLATLDYISDEIQIVYGQPACYGIISQSKAVGRGINEYLNGYLPEDNVRFRDYSIKFPRSSKKQVIEKEILLEFPELEKKFTNFKLNINAGEIHKGEILTVMGANGLGKTTFLKLLSGLEKPTKGKIKKMKIAYKVQYPEANIKGTVIEHLRKIAKNNFNSSWYQSLILEKLNLKPILNNEVNTLSGGELQKVYIAATLSQDCKIFAFDEPSAFIDVEDRLKVAEVIREFIQKKESCAIVVDHDVQFIDYIADSMLVFEGIPAKQGSVYGPVTKHEGMNRVLKILDITYRTDKETLRPRINKPGSNLDTVQRKKGEYYYT